MKKGRGEGAGFSNDLQIYTIKIVKKEFSGQCTGPSVRYISCNLDPCAEGTDFRAEQCTKHNDDALDGNYHKWLPYKGKNKYDSGVFFR